MKIKKGDKVKVLYGKDKGTVAEVLKALPKEGKVVVEGVSVYKKHVKGDGQNVKSQIVEITKPIAVSKVMLIDPESGKPTRVGYTTDKDGNKVRVSKRTGNLLQSGASKAEGKDKKSEDKK